MEKKEVKISLGTTVCAFIILLLIAALIGMYLYYNKNNNKTNNTDNTISKNIEDNAIDNKDTENEKMENIRQMEEAEIIKTYRNIETYKALLSNSPNWVPYYAEENGKEVPLSYVWGTAIKYGGYLSFEQENYEYNNGTYSELIGAYADENDLTGTYVFGESGDTLKLMSNNGETSKVILDYTTENPIIKKVYNGVTVYFRNFMLLDDVEYEQLTNNLEDDEMFYVTEAKDNKDGTYTLYGAIYKRDNDRWGSPQGILSRGNYKKVTLSSDLKMENYGEPGTKTVKERFSDFLKDGLVSLTIDASSNGNLLGFQFQNGKCIEIFYQGLGI